MIDEVAGQLLTLLPLATPAGAAAARPQSGTWFFWVVTGFVAFRVLDIWKPGPVRWAERAFHGGTGVMADDLVAGLLGAGLLVGAIALAGARAV